MLLNSILDAIGTTPLVRLQRIGQELPCELFVKCEFMNPAGSIKDRIAHAMILAAEKEGRIRPGDTLIEATSGNTGIGLAMVAAVRGYRLIIVMPEKNSTEKQILLEAFGATIYRTPNLPREHPESYTAVAKRLSEEYPRAHLVNQFSNMHNPKTHYHSTAEEILKDLDGKVDMVVMSMGTGGTITGVSQRLKEVDPRIQIIGVDPHGSLMTQKGPRKSFLVEGIGSDFIPEIFKTQHIDHIIYTQDQEAFHMARRLVREEGLLAGGSSGSTVWAMLEAAKTLETGQRAVAILPDSARNYMTKFMNAQWMQEQGFAIDYN